MQLNFALTKAIQGSKGWHESFSYYLLRVHHVPYAKHLISINIFNPHHSPMRRAVLFSSLYRWRLRLCNVSMVRQLECGRTTDPGEAHGSWPCHLATAYTVESWPLCLELNWRQDLFLVVIAQVGRQHQVLKHMLQRLCPVGLSTSLFAAWFFL